MRLTIRDCGDVMANWWVIERAEHEGREWWEESERGSTFMTSARFSDADVEGDAEEMLAIARAIRARGSARFTRCAVWVEGDRARFVSPRNSQRFGECSLEEADELADLIEATIPGAQPCRS